MLVNETILVVSTTDHTTWAVSVKTINQRPPNNLHFRFSVSLKRVNLTIHVHSSVPPLTLVDIDHILFQCQELKNRCRISRFRNLFCSLQLKTVMVKFVRSQLFTLINGTFFVFLVWIIDMIEVLKKLASPWASLNISARSTQHNYPWHSSEWKLGVNQNKVTMTSTKHTQTKHALK